MYYKKSPEVSNLDAVLDCHIHRLSALKRRIRNSKAVKSFNNQTPSNKSGILGTHLHFHDCLNYTFFVNLMTFIL